MPIKTCVDDTPEGIDKQVNDFKKDNLVEFMLPKVLEVDKKLRFVYILFYVKKRDIMYKSCPKCKEQIPKIFIKHEKCGWEQK